MKWRFRRSTFASIPKIATFSPIAPISSQQSRFLSTHSPTVASILAQRPAEPCTVDIAGHVRSVRSQKRHAFVHLGDGSTIDPLQAVLSPEQAAGIGIGTALRIRGSWRPCPPEQEQTHELIADQVTILGPADPATYPLQKKYQSPEFLRTIPHLRLRLPFNALLARLRAEAKFVLHSWFKSERFLEVDPPIITSSDCEGAGDVFSVRPKDHDQSREPGEFFRAPKYLTVSSQLHLEAFVHEHPRVWTLSPTFRAEKSDTPRHLSEFYMLEAELQCDNLETVMNVVEDTIRHVVKAIQCEPVWQELVTHWQKSKTVDEAERKVQRWEGIKKPYWPRVPYSVALKMLNEAISKDSTLFKYTPKWEAGLQTEHERYLVSKIGRGTPVFITGYPKAVKPFYVLPSERKDGDDTDQPTVACFDLLVPEVCEVVGGSLREHRLAFLKGSMQDYGILGDAEDGRNGDLGWYLDLRRFGSVPHGGFGLGFDRLLGYLAGVDNIRDVVAWPRYYGKCDG